MAMRSRLRASKWCGWSRAAMPKCCCSTCRESPIKPTKENNMNATVPYSSTTNTAALVGRILLAVMFITSGFGKIGTFEGTVGYIASKHLPLPQLGAIIAIAVELGGGILLAVGYKARWAALAMAIFTLAAGIFFHDYWNADAAAKTM